MTVLSDGRAYKQKYKPYTNNCVVHKEQLHYILVQM